MLSANTAKPKTADDTPPTRTRLARWDASTVFRLRLVRGTLDGTPRPRPGSYEARSIKHPDRVPTHTRLVQLSANLRLTRPRVGSLDPLYSPTLRQKPEHLMRLPATSYHHGHSYDQCGSSAGVSSHFLLPIPGWEVKTCHYTHLTAYCSATDHPRGRIRPYPTILGIQPYLPVLDPTSTQPRPSAGQQGGKADVAQDLGSFHRLLPDVTMVSKDGQPFLGHVATSTSTGINKTSPQSTPSVLASSYPIKGQARALRERAQMNERRKPRTSLQFTDQHLKQSPVYSHFSFETWAQFPLSQLVTPTQALWCKEIQYSSLPAGRRAFLCPNQDKSLCILLGSPFRLGTHSTHSLA
jgi:hypothetical protein